MGGVGSCVQALVSCYWMFSSTISLVRMFYKHHDIHVKNYVLLYYHDLKYSLHMHYMTFKYYKFHFLMNFLESLNQCSFDVVVYFLYKSAVWWLSWSHVLDTACFPFTKYNTYMYTPSVSELIQSCIQTSLYPLINPQLQSVLI